MRGGLTSQWRESGRVLRLRRPSEDRRSHQTIPSAPPNTAAFGPESKRNTAELPRHDEELCYTRMQSTVRENLAWMLRGRCLEGSGPRHPGSILHCTGGHHAGAGYVLHGTDNNLQNVFLKDDFFFAQIQKGFSFLFLSVFVNTVRRLGSPWH